jgi:DNA-binding NarL/FixJ family response regulator
VQRQSKSHVADNGWRSMVPLWEASASGWFVVDRSGALAYFSGVLEELIGARPELGSATVIPTASPESCSKLAALLERLRLSPREQTTCLTVAVKHANRLDMLTVNLLGLPSHPFARSTVVGMVNPFLSARPDRSLPERRADRLGVLEQVLARVRVELSAIDDPEEQLPLSVAEFAQLSPREQEVARLLTAGDRVQVISAKLFITPSTARNHAKAVYRKLGVHSQGELIERYNALMSAPSNFESQSF